MYNGDFSNWVNAAGQQIPIFDPTTQTTAANGTVTRSQFPGNKIPASLFDPQSIQALKTFQASGVLTPNTGAQPGTSAYVTNNYLVTNGTQVQPVNKFSVKGDRVFNSKHRISGYYGYDRESIVPGSDGPPQLPGLYANYNDLQQKSDVFRMSWDWTVSPTKGPFNGRRALAVERKREPQGFMATGRVNLHGYCSDCNDNLQLNFSGRERGVGRWTMVRKTRYTDSNDLLDQGVAHY
jgi:hypothetical protein